MSFSFHCQEVKDKWCAQLQQLCQPLELVGVLVSFFFSLLPLIFTLLTLLCKIIISSYSNTNDKLINCDISILVQYKLYGHYDQYTGMIASSYSCFQEMSWKTILSTIFVCFKVSVYKKWNLATPIEHKIIFFPKKFFPLFPLFQVSQHFVDEKRRKTSND